MNKRIDDPVDAFLSVVFLIIVVGVTGLFLVY